MTVYLDSSVVVRWLRRESVSLPGWGGWEHVYASVLLRVETLRTIDRIRLSGAVDDAGVAELMARAGAVFEVVEFVPLSAVILARASQSFLTSLGTLDALHLSTALRLVEAGSMELTFLTHDAELAVAARSVNLAVEGA
ncbi:MAG: PIN domain-containing protein [Betaproteobacteria bacterium]|nr:PIN domain-containing protein [Betaproteobacteria bacterium]